MCVDCVLTSSRIAHVDPGDEPLPEMVLSHGLLLATRGLFGTRERTTTTRFLGNHAV
jgi:hypothetical protein